MLWNKRCVFSGRIDTTHAKAIPEKLFQCDSVMTVKANCMTDNAFRDPLSGCCLIEIIIEFGSVFLNGSMSMQGSEDAFCTGGMKGIRKRISTAKEAKQLLTV